MSEHNIDRVFKQKLDSYAESPPDLVWNNINSELKKESKENKSIYYRIMIAASIAFLLGMGFAYLIFDRQDNSLIAETSQKENSVDQVIDEIKIVETNHTQKQDIQIENKASENIIPNSLKAVKETIHTNIPQANTNILAVKASENSNDEKIIDNIALVKEEDKSIIINETNKKDNTNDIKKIDKELPLLTETLLFDEEKEVLLFNKEKQTKWIMGGQVTPTYSYRHIVSDNQSANMKEYYNEIESGLLAYSGGINVQYKANSRLSVKSGIYYSKIGQTIENTYQPTYFKSDFSADYQSHSNPVIKSSAGVLNISQPVPNRNSFETSNALFADNSSSSIDAGDMDYLIYSMSFIEVPVLLSYKLIDRKMDVNFIGGLGANFMVDNGVNYNLDGKNLDAGSAEGDINKFNYNGTIGLGVEYNLIKNIVFSVEPTFRYYLSTINQDQSIISHPYSFGFFSGLNYSF